MGLDMLSAQIVMERLSRFVKHAMVQVGFPVQRAMEHRNVQYVVELEDIQIPVTHV